MNRFFYWLAITFFFVAPVRMAYLTNHPGDSWQENPNVFLPIWGVVIFAGGILAVHMYLVERRRANERKKNRP